MFLFYRHYKDVIFLIIFLILSLFFLSLPQEKITRLRYLSGYILFPAKINSRLTTLPSAVKKLLTIEEENLALKKEINRLKQEKLLREEVSRENARLKRLLDLKSELPYSVLTARVIARPAGTLYRSLWIDRGLGQVKKNMVVVSAKEPVSALGKVIAVYPQTSEVLLTTAFESQVSALIQSTREWGVVTGEGRPFLRMKYINPRAEITPGDWVLTSGEGGIFPKGLYLGKVRSAAPRADKLFLEVRLTPAVDFSQLEEVMLIKEYD